MILEYLGYLENAFFVRRVRPVDIQGKKQFRIGEKYYFEDLGIRHVIRPFRPNDIGQVLENVVHHHLMVRGYTVHVGRDGDGRSISWRSVMVKSCIFKSPLP